MKTKVSKKSGGSLNYIFPLFFFLPVSTVSADYRMGYIPDRGKQYTARVKELQQSVESLRRENENLANKAKAVITKADRLYRQNNLAKNLIAFDRRTVSERDMSALQQKHTLAESDFQALAASASDMRKKLSKLKEKIDVVYNENRGLILAVKNTQSENGELLGQIKKLNIRQRKGEAPKKPLQ